ncbi:sialomucin core protein 24-like [Atheta coriaria]|uniref:sialomucin core protein 24-like n=1 Tax=Dalotia coriaria TaxID=877792 RepID=UPI0031F4434B
MHRTMRTHSVVTSAVIASLLLSYACAFPAQETGVPKVGNTTTTIAPHVSLTTVEEKTINPSNKVPTNVTVVVANVSDASTTPNISEPVHPENHSVITTSSSTTAPTTTKPITTSLPTKPTTSEPTTAPPKPTDAPTQPTSSTTSTLKPPTSTEPSKPTAAPTAAPHHNDRKFDGPSFIGGIILACGLSAIGFVAFKFYKARTEHNYHTL